MTWLVTWNGREYDVDPSEFTGLELKLIKDRTNLSFRDLVNGIARFDGEAVQAVFWAVARRDEPDLKFSDFQGPPMKLVVANIAAFNDAMEELGKAADPDPSPETTGSGSSPSTPDGPGSSTTD